MNILYIHRTQDTGVESVHVWEMVRSFKRHGHQVRVHSPAGEAIDPRDKAKTEQGKGNDRTEVLRWISRYLPELLFEFTELAYNLLAYHSLVKTFSDFGHPVVFERYALFGVAGALFARKRNCCWFLELNYTSHCPLVRKRSVILKPLAAFIERRLFRFADGIVVVSNYLKNQLIHEYGVDAAKIIVLPNAADPKTFSPDIAPLDSIENRRLVGHKILGYVGGFNPWHSMDILVRAFSVLTKEFPDARLLLIGDGPEWARMKRLVEDLNLTERVIFTGKISHDSLPRFINAFHLGVLPNSNDYGSPMKIFEYMAMGKPVVVPNYAPLLEVVEDGRQGRIFQKNSLPSLIDSLRQVLTNEIDYEKMSHYSRQTIIETFNWKNNAAAILRMMEGHQ